MVSNVLLFAILFFVALGNSAEGFFHRKTEKASSDKDDFKKLGIERPEKKILARDLTLEDLSGKRTSLKGLRGWMKRPKILTAWKPSKA